MRIASFLQVIDDIETLIAHLAYHASIGVSHFLICDRGASGADRDRLQALADDHIRIFRRDVQELTRVDASTLPDHRLRSYRRAFEEFDADWVLFGDADEFWVPAGGSLAEATCLADADVVTVPRFNAALPRGADPALAGLAPDLETVARQDVFAQRRPFEDCATGDEAVPWVMTQIGPKLISRARNVEVVHQGFHDLRCARPVRRQVASDLAIVHFPFTSLERFTRKVRNIRAHLGRTGSTFGARKARHWRLWAERLTEPAAVAAEYERQFLASETLSALREGGVVAPVREVLDAPPGPS